MDGSKLRKSCEAAAASFERRLYRVLLERAGLALSSLPVEGDISSSWERVAGRFRFTPDALEDGPATGDELTSITGGSRWRCDKSIERRVLKFLTRASGLLELDPPPGLG